jgi:FlgD Ig-like domain
VAIGRTRRAEVLLHWRPSASGDSLTDPALAPDVTGGTYVAWGMMSADGTQTLRGVRLAPDGSVVPGWQPGGNDLIGSRAALVLGGDDFWNRAGFSLGADGQGGLMAAWNDRRKHVPAPPQPWETIDVRVSRLLPDGGRADGWPDGGALVPDPTGNSRVRAVIGDGAGRAYVAWGRSYGDAFVSRLEPGMPVNQTAGFEGASSGPDADGLGRAEPSLFRDRTSVHFRLREAGQVRIAIWDLAGRQVRTLVDAEAGSGAHQAEWDGRDNSGHALGSGTYFLRMTVDGRAIPGHAKAVLLR